MSARRRPCSAGFTATVMEKPAGRTQTCNGFAPYLVPRSERAKQFGVPTRKLWGAPSHVVVGDCLRSLPGAHSRQPCPGGLLGTTAPPLQPGTTAWEACPLLPSVYIVPSPLRGLSVLRVGPKRIPDAGWVLDAILRVLGFPQLRPCCLLFLLVGAVRFSGGP